jgi:hypothetical protein
MRERSAWHGLRRRLDEGDGGETSAEHADEIDEKWASSHFAFVSLFTYEFIIQTVFCSFRLSAPLPFRPGAVIGILFRSASP